MDAVESGIAVAGNVFSGLWTLATGNQLLMIAMIIGLVGTGIGIFFSLKKRLQGSRSRGKR